MHNLYAPAYDFKKAYPQARLYAFAISRDVPSREPLYSRQSYSFYKNNERL